MSEGKLKECVCARAHMYISYMMSQLQMAAASCSANRTDTHTRARACLLSYPSSFAFLLHISVCSSSSPRFRDRVFFLLSFPSSVLFPLFLSRVHVH